MRLFIAINFHDEVKAQLLQAQMALRRTTASGSFTRPENLHLTLVFLGETPPWRVGEIRRVMDATPAEPLTLRFDGMGKFGDTWWVGMQNNPALTGLYNHLAQGLKAAGFPVESRQFKPHLTLAREIHLLEGAAVAQTEGFLAEARVIHLMKSERINGKLTYTSIYEKQLT